jgi:hypothetical protein
MTNKYLPNQQVFSSSTSDDSDADSSVQSTEESDQSVDEQEENEPQVLQETIHLSQQHSTKLIHIIDSMLTAYNKFKEEQNNDK